MITNEKMLTAEQYHVLYLRAFARLEDISRQAERAMEELEELQLRMGDPPASDGPDQEQS
ncbi:hypothetical protein AALA54_02535 [Oscillospiraceae bacterium 44-34]